MEFVDELPPRPKRKPNDFWPPVIAELKAHPGKWGIIRKQSSPRTNVIDNRFNGIEFETRKADERSEPDAAGRTYPMWILYGRYNEGGK